MTSRFRQYCVTLMLLSLSPAHQDDERRRQTGNAETRNRLNRHHSDTKTANSDHQGSDVMRGNAALQDLPLDGFRGYLAEREIRTLDTGLSPYNRLAILCPDVTSNLRIIAITHSRTRIQNSIGCDLSSQLRDSVRDTTWRRVYRATPSNNCGRVRNTPKNKRAKTIWEARRTVVPPGYGAFPATMPILAMASPLFIEGTAQM
jgi:hypothetical protein